MLFLKDRKRNKVQCLEFSPDGRFLACTAEWTVRLWDLTEGMRRKKVRDYDYGVISVAFSPDAKKLVSVCCDSMRWWNVEGLHEKPGCLVPGAFRFSNPLAFIPDGRVLVATWNSNQDWAVHFLNVQTGEEQVLYSQRAVVICAFAIAPGGQILAVASNDKKVKLLDLSEGRVNTTLLQRAGPIDVAFSPDGKTLAVAQGWYPSLWDMDTMKERAVLKGHKGSVNSVAYAPEGNILASGGSDGTVRFWNNSTGTKRAVYNWELGRIWTVAFSPDGLLAAAGGDEGIVIWDVD